jgi:hypothetical protein
MATDSIRTHVLEAVQQALLGMTAPTYWFVPKKVERFWLHPLTDKAYPHYSILTGDEQKSIDGSRGPISLVSCELPVTIAGANAAKSPNSTDRALTGERMMADVERALWQEINGKHIGGVTVGATVTRTELEITEIEAPLLLVGVYALVTYRHQEGDPTIPA